MQLKIVVSGCPLNQDCNQDLLPVTTMTSHVQLNGKLIIIDQ